MADITMCKGKGCPMKDKCYRHTAKKGQLQSWFIDEPIDAEGNCEMFWEEKGNKASLDRALE